MPHWQCQHCIGQMLSLFWQNSNGNARPGNTSSEHRNNKHSLLSRKQHHDGNVWSLWCQQWHSHTRCVTSMCHHYHVRPWVPFSEKGGLKINQISKEPIVDQLLHLTTVNTGRQVKTGWTEQEVEWLKDQTIWRANIPPCQQLGKRNMSTVQPFGDTPKTSRCMSLKRHMSFCRCMSFLKRNEKTRMSQYFSYARSHSHFSGTSNVRDPSVQGSSPFILPI